MPIYEYRCNDCDQVFEEWQKNFDETAIPCPICGGQAHRIISQTSFVLKGSGWYVTDYSRGSSSAAGSASGHGHAGGNGNGKSEGGCSCDSAGSGTEAKKTEAAKPAASDSSTTS